MNIHEYQARELLAAAGIPVPPSAVASTPAEAQEIAARLGGHVVVKAQVHAGGRGKAGGVRLAATPAEARKVAAAILALRIKELPVRQVLVAPACDIDHEYYLGITLDRARQRAVVMASAAGGVDIEDVARETPDRLVRHGIDPLRGLEPYEAREICFRIESNGKRALRMASVLYRLYDVFQSNDASLVEINPLVATKSDEILAIDAKMVIDDNALFRRPALAAMREDQDPNEAEARRAGLSYIKLDGSIGCVVNGAGLAMATMDVIQEFGGQPANFLDIGGSSSPEKVTTALDILSRDTNVKAILFNIFGGITRTDDVAQGIVQVFKKGRPPVPVVIRLTGTNEERAREILTGTGLEATTSMVDGVKEVIKRGSEAT